MQTSLGTKLKEKYPTRIPIIFTCTKNIELSKSKMLIPEESTIAQVMTVLRKYITINKSEALFLFINNKIPSSAEILSSIYEENKNADDLLEITITKENTFG